VFFDGSVCSKGNGAGCVLISPGLTVDICVMLEFVCTNNQAEYESLLCRLDYLDDMGVESVRHLGIQNW
jgi:ribonuclease HI